MSNYQIGISATVLLPRLGDLAGQTRNVLTYQKWKNHEPCNLLAMPLVHDSLKKCLRNAGPSKIYVQKTYKYAGAQPRNSAERRAWHRKSPTELQKRERQRCGTAAGIPELQSLKRETEVRNWFWTLRKGHLAMKMALYGGKGVDMLSC